MKKRTTKTNLKGKEVKMMKKIFLLFSVLALCLFLTTSANAVPVDNVWVPGENQLSDDDAEIWVDTDDSGTFNAGDYLMGVVGITSYTTINEPASNYNELTGVFAIMVNTVLPAGFDFPIGSNVAFGGFTFVPTGDLNAAILAGFGVNLGLANTDANSVVAVFEDSSTDYVRDGVTVGTSFASAADGILRMILGMEGTNTWSGTGPLDPLDPDILALAPGTGIGGFSANLTIQWEDFAPLFDPLVAVVGNLARPQSNSQWPIQSDSTYTLFVVPEPGTFLLLGTGLAGIGIFARFRRRK
jgi:PEP-CTERM motif